MPLVTTDDVAAAILVRWEAVASLKAIVPTADVMVGRMREKTTFPYARLIIEQVGPDQRITGGVYLRRFRVVIEGFTAANPPVSDTLKNALDEAFAGVKGNQSAGITIATATTVIHSKASGVQKTEYTGERRDNADVLRVTSGFEILVQGTTG